MNKPFVAGVIWPQGERTEIELEDGTLAQVYYHGDIQFYSDFLAGQGDLWGEESDLGDQLIEKNRTDGEMTSRALEEVYLWALDNLPGVELTVHGDPIAD